MLVAAQEVNAKALATGRNPHRSTRKWHLVLVNAAHEAVMVGELPPLPPPEQGELWPEAPTAPLTLDGRVGSEVGYRQLEDVPARVRCAACSKLAKKHLGVDWPNDPPPPYPTWRY